jgi:hypothetical protein
LQPLSLLICDRDLYLSAFASNNKEYSLAERPLGDGNIAGIRKQRLCSDDNLIAMAFTIGDSSVD